MPWYVTEPELEAFSSSSLVNFLLRCSPSVSISLSQLNKLYLFLLV